MHNILLLYNIIIFIIIIKIFTLITLLFGLKNTSPVYVQCVCVKTMMDGNQTSRIFTHQNKLLLC